MISGIDVSNHQGNIDWPSVARSDKQFSIAKASEGLDYQDPGFKTNWVSAHARGLVAGSYHFCRPSKFTGSQEADYYLSTIGRRFPGELLAFDLEDDAVDPHADLLAYALDFKRTVQERTGYPPLFYSAPAYMEAHNLTGDTPEHRELAECGLWLANYRDDMPDPPAPWDFIAIWQHSETGRVPGVQGNCDLNWFNGDDIDRLKLYGEPEQVQQESV